VTTATEVRHDAVARLGEIAGYDERLDVAQVLARKQSVLVLHRQALRAAGTDELLRGEVNELLGIAQGKAWLLDDAIHARGLPEPTPTERMSLEDLDRVIQKELA